MLSPSLVQFVGVVDVLLSAWQRSGGEECIEGELWRGKARDLEAKGLSSLSLSLSAFLSLSRRPLRPPCPVLPCVLPAPSPSPSCASVSLPIRP